MDIEPVITLGAGLLTVSFELVEKRKSRYY